MAHDVFISYSHEDKQTAEAMCHWLEDEGIRCWMAPRDVRPGMQYAAEIDQAINSCKVMVVVFSGRTNDSVHVPNEIERAVSKGAPVVPFRIEDVHPSGSLEYYLESRHWLDAITPPLEQHLDRLAQGIRSLLPTLAASPPAHKPARTRKAGPWIKSKARSAIYIVGVVFLILMALGVIGLMFEKSPPAPPADTQEPTKTAVPAPTAPELKELPVDGHFEDADLGQNGKPVVVFRGVTSQAIDRMMIGGKENGVAEKVRIEVSLGSGEEFNVGPDQGWTWEAGETLVASAQGYKDKEWVYHPRETSAPVDEKIATLCQQVSKRCPWVFNQTVRLDSCVVGVGKQMIYTVTLLKGTVPESMRATFLKMFKEMATNMCRSTPGTKELLDSGVTMSFRYYDEQGTFIGAVDVTGGGNDRSDVTVTPSSDTGAAARTGTVKTVANSQQEPQTGELKDLPVDGRFDASGVDKDGNSVVVFRATCTKALSNVTVKSVSSDGSDEHIFFRRDTVRPNERLDIEPDEDWCWDSGDKAVISARGYRDKEWTYTEEEPTASSGQQTPRAPLPSEARDLPVIGGFFSMPGLYGTSFVVFQGRNNSPLVLYGVTITATSESLRQTRTFWQNVAVAPSQTFIVGPLQNWYWQPGEKLTVSAPGYKTGEWICPGR